MIRVIKNRYRLYIISVSLLLFSCNKNDTATVDTTKTPVVSTIAVSNIEQTTATSGGSISNDNGLTVIVKGICWITNQTPTIADNKTSDSTGSENFTSSITGLTANTTYYVRAYVTNKAGTGYGSVLSFTTLKTDKVSNITYGTMTDGESNTYKTITIGTQTWMAENLKVTKYNDSTIIPNVTDVTAWSNLTMGAVCTYINTTNADTIKNYGRLYNWFAVNTGKLCPSGWHVPSGPEWTILQTYLVANGYTYDDSTLVNHLAKSMASTTGWSSSTTTGAIGNNPSTNNKSGFTALPGGY